MMKKLVVILVVLLLAVAALVFVFAPKGPTLAEVEYLVAPRIITVPDQKVIVVTVTGTPGETAKKAFGLLMKTYFKTRGVPRSGPSFKAPRARWVADTAVPTDQWVGHYAMPVPDSLTEIPSVKSPGGLTAVLTTWEYGEVAEVLHKGAYSDETPTIDKLHAFIEEQGYETAGLHEEIYLKGPGMFGLSDPARYLTVIRYQIRRKAAAAEADASMADTGSAE